MGGFLSVRRFISSGPPIWPTGFHPERKLKTSGIPFEPAMRNDTARLVLEVVDDLFIDSLVGKHISSLERLPRPGRQAVFRLRSKVQDGFGGLPLTRSSGLR